MTQEKGQSAPHKARVYKCIVCSAKRCSARNEVCEVCEARRVGWVRLEQPDFITKDFIGVIK